MYLDHLKHFHFSKDLQNQATVERRRNREQGLQLGRVATIWRVKISLCFLTWHSLEKTLPSVQEKNLKNEKIGLNNQSFTRRGAGISDN